MPKALPKFNWRMQFMTGVIPQFFWLRRRRCPNSTGNLINDKSRPNSTTNNHDSSGYAGGAAQITQASTIKDKSCPDLTTNIHDSPGYAGGAAQI
jgi:hypothetical protein